MYTVGKGHRHCERGEGERAGDKGRGREREQGTRGGRARAGDKGRGGEQGTRGGGGRESRGQGEGEREQGTRGGEGSRGQGEGEGERAGDKCLGTCTGRKGPTTHLHPHNGHICVLLLPAVLVQCVVVLP